MAMGSFARGTNSLLLRATEASQSRSDETTMTSTKPYTPTDRRFAVLGDTCFSVMDDRHLSG